MLERWELGNIVLEQIKVAHNVADTPKPNISNTYTITTFETTVQFGILDVRTQTV